MNWDECLQHAEVSDIGMRRTTNQDAYRVVLANDTEAWRHFGHLFVVADGMGAHAAGELASEMAVSGIAHRYHKYHDLSAPEALHRAISETNAEIHQRGQANIDFHNMGTTTSALVLLPQGALVAHVGDSRVYRLRDAALDQLTFDHSLVWELRANGQIDGNSEWAKAVPKNIITRSLGPNPTVQADFEGPFPVELNDVYLLCSDGLSGLVEDREIGAVLATLPPREAAQALVDLANLRGGPDNVTALIVKVTGESMTTRASAATPLTIHREKTKPRVHPVLWIVAGVCLLAAVVMTVGGQMQPALICLGGGVIALLFAAIQRWALSARDVAIGQSRRLGKGPHAHAECPVDAEFISTLTGLVEQLKSAIEEASWTVDSERFNKLCDTARQAAEGQQFSKALSAYLQAISFMMNELREHHRRGEGGPSAPAF